MNFHSMKRKELQALCKKHKIPANLSNMEMANKLKELLKEKEKPSTQGLIKGQGENASETESANGITNRKFKKVRFSPEHELIEFTRSREMKRTRRNSVASRSSSLYVENVDSGETNKENVGSLGRVTRSGGLKLLESEVNGKKRGRKGLKCYIQKHNEAAIENFDNGELIEEELDKTGRVMQLRGKVLVKGVENESKKGRKRAKNYDRRDEKTLNNANDEKSIEEFVAIPSRITRSRRQKLAKASKGKDNRGGNVVKNNDNVAALISTETDENRVASKKSLRNKGIVGEEKLTSALGERVKNNGKECREVPKDTNVMVEPQMLLRRSKRNASRNGDSEILNGDAKKHENGGVEGLRETTNFLEAEGSGVDTESTGSKADTDGRTVVQIQEPIKLEVQRSNRRKSALVSHEKWGNDELKAETESRYSFRSSVQQLETAAGVSEDMKKVPQPTVVVRRSRRNILSVKPVSGDEKFDTAAAMEKFETEKQSSKPCLVEMGSPVVRRNTRRSRRNASKNKSLEILDEFGVDSVIQQKNEPRKRKRGCISGGDVIKSNNDSSSLTQSMRKASGSKKAAPAAAIVKVSDEKRPPSRWKEPNVMDASSHEGLVETGESFFVDTQLSMSKGAESINNPSLSDDTTAKSICDVGLSSGRKTLRKKKDVSIADSAENADVNLINENELTNSDKNAASRIAEWKSDYTNSEKRISANKLGDVEKVHLMLEFHVQELIVENISDTVKNDHETQVFSQTKDYSCGGMIDNKVLLEGSIVSGDAGFAETSSSAGSILSNDQTELQTDPEATRSEADKHAQQSVDAVDRVGEVEGVFIQENLVYSETEHTNALSLQIACHLDDVDHLESLDNISENNNEDMASKAGDAGAFEFCENPIDSADSKSALQLKEPSPGQLRRSLKGDNTAEGDGTYSEKGIDSKVAENDEAGCLKGDKSTSNEDSEFSMPDLFDGEESARIIPQDRGIYSGECSVMDPDVQRMYNESLAVSPISIYANSTNLKRGLEAYHIAERENTCINMSLHSEFTKTDEAGSSKGHRSKCDENGEFSVSNLFDTERRPRIMPQDRELFPGENSINDSDEQGMLHNSLSVASTPMRNCDEIKLREGHEADQIAEAEDKSIKDEGGLAEADEGGCLKDQKSTKDDDWLFSVSNLFDAERSARITPQDRGSSSLQEISPSKPNSVSGIQGSVSTVSNMCEIIDKEDGAADAMCEIIEEEEDGAVGTMQENEATIFQRQTLEDEIPMDKSISDGEHEIFNQADEHTNKDTYELAEQPKSSLPRPTCISNTFHEEESLNGGNEKAEYAMSMFNTNGKVKSSLVVEGSNNANDANCRKVKEFLADASIPDVAISKDYTISKIGAESLSELNFQDIEETEYQCENLLEGHAVSDVDEEPSDVESRRSWTEIELNNLFGTPIDTVTPTRPNDTSSGGTEIAKLAMPMNKSVANSDSSLTKKEKKEMEEERGSAKTTNKNVVLPTNYEEESENQLKLLFATPVKTVAPCNIDEEAHDGKSDRAATLFKECICMKENVVAQIKSGIKSGDTVRELGNSLCLGNLLSDNAYATNEALNQVKNVDLVNVCTAPVLSEAEYDGCEASKAQLTENYECMKETTFITEENEEEKIRQSYLHMEATDNDSEWTEKNIISSSGSLKNLDKIEGCGDMSVDNDFSEKFSYGGRPYLTSEGDMAQSSEAAFQLSDANFQRSNIPENSHGLPACYEDGNILRETSIDNFKASLDAEVAKLGSFDGGKDETDKGTSPISKASEDDDEVRDRKDVKSIREDDDKYGAKIWDKLDDNSSSSHDISVQLHTNSEVEVVKSLSVDYTLCEGAYELPSTIEPHSTCKETKQTDTTTQNVDNIVPAAEHRSSVCGADSDILSSLAMHLLLGDNENGEIQKSEVRAPLFSLRGDFEKNGKEIAENSAATTVQYSISELQLEEKFVEFKNDIHTVSDVSASSCNEILKESDVADTIKEYIDSESSLSVDFEGSAASLPVDLFTHIDERYACENAALCESEEDINGKLDDCEGKEDKPTVESLETESKELEEATHSVEPASGSKKAVKCSPPCVDLLVEGSTATKPQVETKGEEVEAEALVLFKEPAMGPNIAGSAVSSKLLISQKEIGSSSKQLLSTEKRNARTILIHGTPSKHLATLDMKENAPMHKNSNIGDFTTVRAAKRRALQDVQWK